LVGASEAVHDASFGSLGLGVPAGVDDPPTASMCQSAGCQDQQGEPP
jgi:hypothetical protein